jgi:hypothetical protein
MMPLRRALPFVLLALSLATCARADRKYFVHSYTSYLAPAGSVDLEVHSYGASGQGDTTGTGWTNRVELEVALSDRFTGAMYLNFLQDAGEDAAMRFDGPSLEGIYRLAEPGRWIMDPSLYLEVRANGTELEMEPKLLLSNRFYRLVSVLNVIGEFERVDGEPGWSERALVLTGGTTREIGNTLAVGIEAIYTRSLSDDAHPNSLQLGPTVSLQKGRIQAALGWQPQLVGRPETGAGLNLADFPRSEVRLIVGVGL